MDFTSIGISLAKIGAPMIASLFLGPEAGALTTVVINKLSAVLGVPATPEAVNDALAKDPDAAAKVAPVEAEHKDSVEAYLADVANARTANVQLVQAGSSIAYGPVVISVIITVGFFAILLAMLVLKLDAGNPITIAVLNVLVGTLGAGFAQVGNYWLGSTANSKSRMDQLATIAQSAVGVAPKTVGPARKAR